MSIILRPTHVVEFKVVIAVNRIVMHFVDLFAVENARSHQVHHSKRHS